MDKSKSPKTVAVEVDLRLADATYTARGRIPHEQSEVVHLLPILRSLDDEMAKDADQLVRQNGKQISCRKGCAACCRQIVPISDAEALALGQLIDDMPPTQQDRVRRRFEEAVNRLDDEGLVERLWSFIDHNEDITALAADYFRHVIACPFLEDELCTIYKDRPLACREYLVTSPVANCDNPGRDGIERVPLPVRLARVLFRLDSDDETKPKRLPLILAMQWIKRQGDQRRSTSDGLLLIARFLKQLEQSKTADESEPHSAESVSEPDESRDENGNETNDILPARP